MQQSQAISYYYQTGLYNQDGGGPATHPAPGWMQQDNAKNNQFPHQWDNNGGFHVTGGNQYGASQVQGSGGQNRVQVPQQPQTPQQPPPTSNTPPNIHVDMSKQPLMPNQGAPLNFVPRLPNQSFAAFPRGAMTQQQAIRPHGRQTMGPIYHVPSMSSVLTSAPAQAITTQVLPYSVMYGAGVQPRQNAPPYAGQGQQFIMPQQFYNPSPAPTGYYPAVIPTGYQNMSSGGPSPQAGGQGTVPMMRSSMVPNTTMAPPPSKQEPKKRPNAIKIINPESGDEVVVENENSSNNNNITPTRSNDSSARETPQPNSGVTPDNSLAADFVARVAAVAGEPTTPAQPPPEQPIPPELTPASDSDHKQSSTVPTSEKPYPQTVLSMASKEFVPRSHKQQLNEPVLVEEQLVQLVPTVSAETNSPAIELQRSKEFPVLKNPPAAQSPVRGNAKKKANEPAAVPQPLPDNKEANKKAVPRAGGLKEELPKEKRDRPRSVSKEQSPAPSPVVAAEVTSSQSETIATVKTVPTAPVKEPVKSNSLPPSVVEDSVNNKILQHQNGETALPEPAPLAVDGSKAARQKSKSNKKMREQLNRKGVDKEGSDMDAFTDTSIVAEEKERPSTPASPPSASPPPMATATIEAPQSHEDKIKEDLEEKEDKQERLVAAKNEENVKVSALSHEDKADTPVIEKVEEKKPPQLTLRRSYRKDQWSPLNPDGKKKYERDFLIELKNEPQSNVKPENLPDVVAVIRDSSNLLRNNNQSMNFMNNRGDIRGMLPDFLRSSQSQRGSLPKGRNSQQGKKNQNPKVIHMSLSLHEDVKLKTAENAWKPHRLESDAGKNDDDKENEKLYKEVRGILNKLTPQKFDTLMKKFLHLPINSEERLNGVIHLIFDKAVDEPNFSKAYANMCKICSKIEVTKIENSQEQKVNFRKILITRCQTEFESNKSSELDAAKWLEEIKNCTDPEQKKELQLQYEEKERGIRRKSVGNIRFIGELFKLGMLTPAIMYRCIEHLLSTPEEESLECLCKLLTTIGKDLELGQHPQQKQATPGTLNPYFQRMSDLAQKREGSKVSSRVRFMLQDVIELRQNKWVPRREDNNPKTIEQITKEAERESLEMSMALQQPAPRMNRQNDRQDDRKRNNRGGNNQSDNDGWVNVTPSSRYHSKPHAFESSKMLKNEISADLNSLSLGGRSQFIFQTTSKSMESQTAGPVFTSNNVYSALQPEKKQTPQPSMNSRRLTPTPSIEKDKERQRMIQGAFESDGRNSRGNSMQRERPVPLSSQPPSRESSIPRQLDNKEAERRDKRDDKVDEAARRAAEEKLERQTQTIFDEYLASLSRLEDVKQDIESTFNEDNIGSFISRGLELSLEKKAGAQKRIGELFTALMDHNVFSPEVFVEQLSLIYESSEDMAIDVPKVWELQAQVIVPILAAEKINFGHIKAACSPVLKTKPAVKLLVPILTLLAEEKKPRFVRDVWDSSNVSLKDFLPADVDVDAFIKDNSLEYLTGEPPSIQLPMDEVQDKMIRLMQTNTPCDQIFQFISNVGGKVESLQFIRALITAICTACLTESNHTLDLSRFKEYEKLIQRYVDNKEDRELACLSSVHVLSNQLDHPQGLIMNIFNLFLDNNLISCESFLKWREDDTEKLENKGVSLYALTSFFAALEEVESEDENS